MTPIKAEGLCSNLFLSEIINYAYGNKSVIALEFGSEDNLRKTLDQIRDMIPGMPYKITPHIPWISKANQRYEWNLFLGDGIDAFERLYSKPQPHSKEDNARIADMLGYPDCCADSLLNLKPVFKYFSQGYNSIDWRLNNMYKRSASNANIVRHYLCDYNCRKSLSIVNKILHSLKLYHPDVFYYLNDFLRRPILMLVSDKNPTKLVGEYAIFTFTGRFKSKNELLYTDFINHALHPGTCYKNKIQASKLDYVLRRANRIVFDKTRCRIYSDSTLLYIFSSENLVFINPQ